MLGIVQLEQIFSPQRSFILSCDTRIFFKKNEQSEAKHHKKLRLLETDRCAVFLETQRKEKSPMRCERIAAAFKEKTSD